MDSEGPETNRLPPLSPADCGAKARLTVTLCPTPRVRGNFGPLIENPAPVIRMAERVTFHVRAFVSTTGIVAMAPIATCPNATAGGLEVTALLFTPEPPTSSRRVEFDALLKKSTAPPAHP